MSNLAVENVKVASANIVGIDNQNASIKIFAFLEDKKRKSKNTYDAYSRYYTEFFRFAFNKEISQVTWDDILGFAYSNTLDYKEFLLKKDTPSYTNQKMFSIKALWKRLYSINHNIDMKVWDFEEEEYEKNHYADLSEEEINLLLNFAEQEKYKPKTKKLFFNFLYIIGCRKNIPLTIEWDKNFIRKYDAKNKIDLWVVKYYDKGKWIEKAIHDDFYNQLIELKTCGESKSRRVFDINQSTIEELFDKFQAKYNLYTKEGQRITIHSLKKSSGWLVQNVFGDLYKTQKHLQHKNPQLTAETYLQNESYADQASYMIGKNIDMNFFRSLDKEELIKLIESRKDIQLGLYYEWVKGK